MFKSSACPCRGELHFGKQKTLTIYITPQQLQAKSGTALKFGWIHSDVLAKDGWGQEILLYARAILVASKLFNKTTFSTKKIVMTSDFIMQI